MKNGANSYLIDMAQQSTEFDFEDVCFLDWMLLFDNFLQFEDVPKLKLV